MTAPEQPPDPDRQRGDGPWSVLPLAGEIDLASAPATRLRIGQMTVDPPAYVVLDVHDLQFIDSTGLGVIVGALRRVRDQGGDLRIAGAGAGIRRVFSVTGLDRVFRSFDTVEAACRAPLDEGPVSVGGGADRSRGPD